MDGGHDDAAHTGLGRPAQDLRTVRVETAVIQVGVAIG